MRTEKRKAAEPPVANDAEAPPEEAMPPNNAAVPSEKLLQQQEDLNLAHPTPAADTCAESGLIPPSADDIPPEEAENNKESFVSKRRKSNPKLKRSATSHAWKCICCTQSTAEKPRASDAKKLAIARGEEVKANLDPSLPACIKSMSRNNVTVSFWMGLPGPFSRAFLPHTDADLTLVDEQGADFAVRYMSQKSAISSGWRHFAVSHSLVEDDVLVFQLVSALKLKVYIIRAHKMTEVDGALGLLNLDTSNSKDTQRGIYRRFQLLLSKTDQLFHSAANESEETPEFAIKHCNGRRRKRSKSLDDVSDAYETAPDPVKQDSFDDPSLAEVPDGILSGYQDLCESQGAPLHATLVESLNQKLVAGLITEVVRAAEGIRWSTVGTVRHGQARWDKTLGAAEVLGMQVGFLRRRCEGLVQVACESAAGRDAMRYAAVRDEVAAVEEAAAEVEKNLRQLEAAQAKCSADIDEIHVKAHKYETHFRNEVFRNW